MATSQFLADRAGELIAGGWLELLQREKGTNLFTLWPAQRCVLSLTSPTGTLMLFPAQGCYRKSGNSKGETRVQNRPKQSKARSPSCCVWRMLTPSAMGRVSLRDRRFSARPARLRIDWTPQFFRMQHSCSKLPSLPCC